MSKEIQKSLRRLLPHLLSAQDSNLNEADTLLRIIKVFEDVLGYDPLSEISREAQVRDKYVDLSIKIDGVTKLLVEAKAAGTELRERHIEQAQRYASEGNMRWVLLTNGVHWTLYHLTFEEGIDYAKALSFDLKNDPLDICTERLALLERKAVARGALENYWTHRVALGPESIGKALFTEEMLGRLRREIRRREKIPIDVEDLCTALHGMFSTEAREQIGPLKIRKKTPTKAKVLVPAAEAQPAASIQSPPADPVAVPSSAPVPH